MATSNTNTLSTYIYTPLSPEAEDEIRLLHLKPAANKDDPIKFTLHPARLSDKPEYEALSYTWGDPKDTRPVYCGGDGAILNVTISLFTALKRLRLPDKTRVIWADAACIDQSNIPEKSIQVQLMGRIYSQPSRLLIWLGEDTSGLEGLHQCIAQGLKMLPPDEFDQDPLYEHATRVVRDAWKLRREGKPSFLDHDWRPFASLLCRPWFDRRWIIQETVLPSDDVQRLALCGSDIEFRWDDLASIAYRLCAYGLSPLLAGYSSVNSYAPYFFCFYADNARPLQTLTATSMVYMLRRYRKHGNLVDSVIATSLFKCTDSRDHLYSLIGLPTSRGTIPTGTPMADYNLSAAELCKRFATATIVTDQNLKLLSIAPHSTKPVNGHMPPRLQGIPSWVPDLTVQGFVDPLASYTIRPQLFHAGGVEKPLITVSADGSALHLRGFIVDSVAAMARTLNDIPFPSEADVHPNTDLCSRVKKQFMNWMSECRDVAAEGDWESKAVSTEDDALGGTDLQRAFIETVTCGMTGLRDPLTKAVSAATSTYIDYLFGFFTEGYRLSEDVRTTLLTYGALVEQSLGVASGRRFCRTQSGRLGQVRFEAKEGDLFCIILGAEVPYLLRPSTEKEDAYVLIGDCFLHGMMQGEALNDVRYAEKELVIV